MSNDPGTLGIQENVEHAAQDLGRSAVRFFALIIGIDHYADSKWPDLHGAVADAMAMKRYLVDMLRVSESHIIALYNRRATRRAIIEAFQKLRDDKRINHGDPIVIFYSGHGGQVSAPDTWVSESERKIQAIISQDGLKAPAGTEVPKDRAPILDITIGALIRDIAKAKGDNITLIFDCCYSGSATRDYRYVPRGVHIDFNIPEALDEDILKERAAKISDDFAYSGVASHILLAACREREFAYECAVSRRGRFTVALLDRLQNCPISDLSYTKLLEGIRLENQHPQCIGTNRHRVLFDAKVHAGSHIFHPVHVCKSDQYSINAGLVHGVWRGVEFTLYDDKKGRLGVVPVNETSIINDFETVVTSVPLPGVSFAKLTRVGKIPLYVDNDSAALDFLQHSDGYDTDAQQFRLVQAEEEANLEVTMENDRVVFRTIDEEVKELGLTKLPHAATPDNIARVLASAARYYWFLGSPEKHGMTSSKDEIALDFYLLNVAYDDFGLPIFYPGKPLFSQTDPNLRNSDVIDLVVDPGDVCYGLKITNNTPRDLFLNVFLFNNSDLSIVSYYTPAGAGESEAPLKKKGGSFTVGYGTEGTPPFFFKLEECQDVDVSQLKIFFATQQIDMSDIAQRSPFSKEGGREGTDEDEGGRAMSGTLKKVILAVAKLKLGSSGVHKSWFALDIPIVQRRKARVEAA